MASLRQFVGIGDYRYCAVKLPLTQRGSFEQNRLTLPSRGRDGASKRSNAEDLRHAEKRQGSRRCDFGRHAQPNFPVGRTRRRSLSGWVCISVREADHSPFARQRLAKDIFPKLAKIELEWATFQVLRKTNASLSKKAGVDPKVASDQRGHGLGVSMEVYTNSDLEQKREALKKLEAAVFHKPQPSNPGAVNAA
jgi:hypothetical protein